MTPVGRNDPCPCGSGMRYKHCHGAQPAAVDADSLAKQGIAAHAEGRLDEAERLYRAALHVTRDHNVALHYLGVVLYQRNRLDEALALLEATSARAPDEPEFHNNRGLALAAAQRDEDAIAAYRRVLELKPDHTGACNNLGLALQATGDLDGAIAAFCRGLAIAPDFAPLHWNLGLALLLQGDYLRGWPEYEWRLRTPELARFVQRYPGRTWKGEDPAGRTLLVTAEQGLGDAIQFLRFAGRLAEAGARVIAVVPHALRALAATAPGVTAAIAGDEPLPAYDAHIPLMSLPAVLGIARDDVAVAVPYLRATPAGLPRDQTNVGIAWAGASENTQDARRSLPLSALAPLFDIPNVRLYSLKRESDVRPADREWAQRMVELPERNDFDGLASLVASLDLVVSVDTSLVHLAGALGKPVWALLAFAPDWRWGTSGSESLWYPTARLFRQRVKGDWAAPVAEIATSLRGLSRTR
jgi:Flp pilus assembly protein TadD